METSNLLFFDTEFTGLRQDTTLISLGITDITGEYKFYAELTDYDSEQINDWLRENVLKNLFLIKPTILPFSLNIFNEGKVCLYKGREDELLPVLTYWLMNINNTRKCFRDLVMWSDCYAYDWVLMRDIFFDNDPTFCDYIPRDLCTLFDIKGIDPDESREEFIKDKLQSIEDEMLTVEDYVNASGPTTVKHNALWDALVIRECYKKLMEMPCVN